ncbi:MAG: ribosome assembly RNA-binding protein YhbY [Clostridia bacterium]|nr:ribosome assembly RNA-binding protein YhbY [Clostridia bacterium]
MLTSKQRAQLRSMASKEDTIMQVGKSGVTEPMVKTVSDALEARELIKMRVLENSGEAVRDVAEQLAAATDAEVVAVIGKCLILYRESKNKKNKIELC